jgi:hypothetical protein
VVWQVNVWYIMRAHVYIPWISIDDWWTNLSVAADITVHTVSYPNIVGGNTYLDILTLVDGTSLAYSCYHYRTVYTVADLKELNISVYIDVGILATYDSHILVLNLILSDWDAFVESIHVHDFFFFLMWWENLNQPFRNDVHMHFHWMTSRLEEWSQTC